MGLLEKVKGQAATIAEKAQHGVEQGREKIEDLQLKKRKDAMLYELGVTYYAQLRHGGSEGAVWEALAQLDAFVAEHPADTTPADTAATDTAATDTGSTTSTA